MRKKNNSPEFWVSNISDRNVMIGDLRLNIPARRHMNLLDSRHFHFTYDQLKKSAESGSLRAKSNMIKVRLVPPDPPAIKSGLHVSKAPLYLCEHPELSRVVIKEEYYEELDLSDEQFAEEMTKDDEGS